MWYTRWLAIVFLMISTSCLHRSKTCASAKIINVVEKLIGPGDSIFSGYHNAKASTESYIKLLRGDSKGAKLALQQALTSLVVLNMGSLLPISTQDIVESFVKSQAFKETKKAVRSYNTQLLNKAKEAARFKNQPQPKTYKKMADLKKTLDDMKDMKINAFAKEIKAVKTTNPTLYNKFGKVKKWLKFGKAGKALGPLLDVISIGVNVWILTEAKPGSSDQISAAINIVAGVIGVVGFFAALALGAPIIGTVAVITGAILGIAATLVPYFGSEPPKYTIEMALEDKFKDVVEYRKKVQKFPETAVDYFGKTKTNDWSYCYVLSQTNLVRWMASNGKQAETLVQESTHAGGYHLLPKPLRNVEFGDFNPMFGYKEYNDVRNPYANNKNNQLLECLPYKGKLNVNGNLQYATHKLPASVEGKCNHPKATNAPNRGGKRALAKIGFDFIGLKNEKATNPLKHGLIVLCITNLINNVKENYRGLDVRTETSRTPHQYRDGNDLVLLDDMRKLKSGEKIKVSTKGGNDVLSITHFLLPSIDRTYKTHKPTLDGDLGSGYDVLSFAGMSKGIGYKVSQINKQKHTLKFFFTGITYRFRDGWLAFRYFYRKVNYGFKGHYQLGKWSNANQWVGTVTGAKLFDSSPFDDVISLDLGEKYIKDSKDFEDFAVINHRGHNTYKLEITQSDDNGYIRKYIIIDKSSDAPFVELTVPNSYRNNLALKADKILMLYGDEMEGARKQIFILKMLDLKTTFHLWVNGDSVSLNSLPVSYVNGQVFRANVKTASIDGTAQNDEVTVVCDSKKDLKNNRQVSINLKEGSKDTLIISAKYFIEPCDVGLEQEFEDGAEERMYEVSMYLDASTPEPTLILSTGESQKRIVLTGVERIANDMGSTIADLTRTGRSNIDLFLKYEESMKLDAKAVTDNAPYFGGVSNLVLKTNDLHVEESLMLEIVFKPEVRQCNVMVIGGETNYIALGITRDGKLGVSSESNNMNAAGYILMNGWNVAKIHLEGNRMSVDLNGNKHAAEWTGGIHPFDDLTVGHVPNIESFENFDANIGVYKGFRGEVLEVMYNGKALNLHIGSVDYKTSEKIREYGAINTESIVSKQ